MLRKNNEKRGCLGSLIWIPIAIVVMFCIAGYGMSQGINVPGITKKMDLKGYSYDQKVKLSSWILEILFGTNHIHNQDEKNVLLISTEEEKSRKLMICLVDIIAKKKGCVYTKKNRPD